MASQAKTGAIASSTSQLQIGGDSIYGQAFSGLIDQVRIYNGALSAGGDPDRHDHTHRDQLAGLEPADRARNPDGHRGERRRDRPVLGRGDRRRRRRRLPHRPVPRLGVHRLLASRADERIGNGVHRHDEPRRRNDLPVPGTRGRRRRQPRPIPRTSRVRRRRLRRSGWSRRTRSTKGRERPSRTPRDSATTARSQPPRGRRRASSETRCRSTAPRRSSTSPIRARCSSEQR